jgi:hypothetical protein
MVMLDTIDGLPPLAREALKQIGVEAETAGELSDANAVQQLQACLGLLKCTQEELPAQCEAGCLRYVLSTAFYECDAWQKSCNTSKCGGHMDVSLLAGLV